MVLYFRFEKLLRSFKKRKMFYVVLLLSAALQVQGYTFCFVKYSNLFRQAENCYSFSDIPPRLLCTRSSAVRCLLSHCCRQLAVCRQVSIVGLLCSLGHPHFYPQTHSNQHVGLQCTLALQHTTVNFCLTPCSGLSTAGQPTPPHTSVKI